LADKIPVSLKRAQAETGEDLPEKIKAQQQALVERWPAIEARLKDGPPPSAGAENRDAFLKEWELTEVSSGHCKAVNSLSPGARKAGSTWLQEIVNSADILWMKE
jgi:hypothetical protein